MLLSVPSNVLRNTPAPSGCSAPSLIDATYDAVGSVDGLCGDPSAFLRLTGCRREQHERRRADLPHMRGTQISTTTITKQNRQPCRAGSRRPGSLSRFSCHHGSISLLPALPALDVEMPSPKSPCFLPSETCVVVIVPALGGVWTGVGSRCIARPTLPRIARAASL
jgi:hypothetical protein